MVERGGFVVLEGGAGAGKSTVLNGLRQELPDWDFYREPGSTPFGEMIREAVQGIHGHGVDRYASLFAYSAARANLVRRVIIPRLEKGHHVLLDRYWYSTYAYQGAEGVSKPIIWAVSMLATQRLKPDLVLHYDLLPELGKERKRGRDDADRYDIKNLEFHKKVRANYLQLGKLYPGIWRTIDASQAPRKVLEDSLKVLREFDFLGSGE